MKKNKRKEKKRTSKIVSGVSEKPLSGVPHNMRTSKIRKLSKTQKRPSTMFAGTLNAVERKNVFEEAAKILTGSKKINETSAKLRPFIEQATKKMAGQQWK